MEVPTMLAVVLQESLRCWSLEVACWRDWTATVIRD